MCECECAFVCLCECVFIRMCVGVNVCLCESVFPQIYVCVGWCPDAAVKMLFFVKMKWFLILLCMVVCGLATPLLELAHNGLHPNDLVYGLFQGLCMGGW